MFLGGKAYISKEHWGILGRRKGGQIMEEGIFFGGRANKASGALVLSPGGSWGVGNVIWRSRLFGKIPSIDRLFAFLHVLRRPRQALEGLIRAL